MEQLFDELRIGLASSDEIRSWSYGEVRKPETINYRTLKPEKEGLFDERIFGPQRDWECYCGKYKQIRYKGIICERCGVEVTRSQVRRERMGHIDLAAPVTHIWLFKGVPSQLSYLLDMSPKNLEKVIYFAAPMITAINREGRAKDLMELRDTLDEERAIILEEFTEWDTRRMEHLEGQMAVMEESDAKKTDINAVRRESEKLVKDRKFRQFKEVILLGKTFDVFREMKVKDLIEDEKIETRSISTSLLADWDYKAKDLPSTISITGQELWRELKERYPDYFEGGMGAESVRDLLEGLDLDGEMEKLQGMLEKSQQRRLKQDRQEPSPMEDRTIKRMKVVRPFWEGKNETTDMVLEAVPVIPPDLRPMVQLDGGRFATSDLNDLYRRVINRNNRLKRLLELNAPEIIVNNEKRMLQESVDALFDNGRRGKAVTGGGENRSGIKKGRPLKSLSHMLKGKQGRFRQNLLGKRVDYSARSVVVIGPQLQLHQCGLPKSMALELFKPFVMKELCEKNMATNIKTAKRMVERRHPNVWNILGEVIQEHPVMLNRAPTLHRLGIQAFEPVLVEGKAIQIHPLVCEAFNADFDGDQMAVHLPLSAAAQAEARLLMLATNNVLSPASGRPVVTPSQDMVLGVYYLTLVEEDALGAGRTFSSMDEAFMSFDQGELSVHAPIKIRVGKLAGSADDHNELSDDLQGLISDTIVNATDLTETTLGQALFNTAFPDDFPYIQKPKKVEIEQAGPKATDLQHKDGVAPAIQTDNSTGIQPKNTAPQAKNAFKDVDAQELAFKKADLQRVIEVLIQRYQKQEVQDALDTIKELGFRFATRAGVTIALHDVKTPIEKTSILSEYETRATTVQDHYQMGIFTRDEMRQELIEIWTEATDAVREAMDEAHHAEKFNSVDMMVRSGARGNAMQIRQLAGMRGMVVNPKGEIITRPILSNFREGMSVLEYFISTHGARKGLTDTALRTASSGYLTRRLVDVSQELIVRKLDCETDRGIRVDLIENDRLTRHLRSRLYGRVIARDIKIDRKIVETKQGDKLRRGAIIETDQLVRIQEVAEQIERVTIRSPLACDARLGICQACYGLNLASGELVEIGEAVGIMAAQSIGEPGTQLTMRTFHTGGIVGQDITHGLPRVIELFEARNPKGEAFMSDIQGTARVLHNRDGQTENIVIEPRGFEPIYINIPSESRIRIKHREKVTRHQLVAEPPKHSELEEITVPDSGRVLILDHVSEHEDGLVVLLSADAVIYPVPHHAQLHIKDGDEVEPGDRLNAGPFDPKKVLRIKGVRETQNYLLAEIQDVYRSQGVEIHDKHIELIVRQMLRRIKVEEPNDSDFIPGEMVDEFRFQDANQELMTSEQKPAHGRQQLMGLIKASLATESWLSAASFQETTRILTDASVQRKSDYMRGLKESVIIGKLIPAGTGSQDYQRIQPTLPDATTIQSIGLLDSDDVPFDEGMPSNPAEWLASLGEAEIDDD